MAHAAANKTVDATPSTLLTECSFPHGAYKGGKARINPETVRALLAEGVRPAHVARQLGISRGTVYRFVAEKGQVDTDKP